MSDEAQTRRELIDQQLAEVGWSREANNVIEEFRLNVSPATFDVAHSNQIAEQGVTYKISDSKLLFVDYVLLSRDGRPLAIVEAKRTSRDALAGQRQAADYADAITATYHTNPFIFLTNGRNLYFWDRPYQPLREAAGFFTPDDLERLQFQREFRLPLEQLGPLPRIVERPYQVEAVKRVAEGLEKGQRKFLLVMATGTGKTRTVLALVELLLRARRVQRVLFLADRRELVRQALNDFKEYLPNETRARLEGGEVDHSARIHVSTYPSMMGLFKELSAGYYDFIIADESHRSIYNRYRGLFEHFDALQLGLTATPTDYIDHNTFDLFQCPNGLPTFYYPYETAVQEKYLVNYRVLEAQTSFQLQGIKAGQLPPRLQQQLEEQGIDPDEIDFEGSDLERRVTNTGTNDAIIEEFMSRARRDATGTLPAKTIIFAMSHRHAVELWQSFNRLYPDLQRLGLAEVIDSHMERVDKTLEDFKRKDMPRVAISVDMLDTGIDVPAIQNLVFARPVFSQVKFWQMIGRGTRLWADRQTGQIKQDFLVIDHWNNFAYFNLKPEGEIASQTEPLPVRLFRARLDTLYHLQAQASPQATRLISVLQEMLTRLPADNINIRPYLNDLQRLTAPGSPWTDWQLTSISQDARQFLEYTIAPLLRFLPDIDLAALMFELRTEKLTVAFLTQAQDQIEEFAEEIQDDLQRLPTSLQVVQVHAVALAHALSQQFWEHLSYAAIVELQTTFAPLMRYRQHRSQEIIRLNLPDQISTRRWIIYGPGGEGAWAESYREQVEAHLKDLAEQLPTLDKLRQDQPLSEAELRSLEENLNRPDLFVTTEVLRQVYERPQANLVELLHGILHPQSLPDWEEQIKTAFDEFIATHPHFSARQVNLLRAIRSAVLRRATLTSQDLEQPPFSRVGSARQLFTGEELDEVLTFANRLVG